MARTSTNVSKTFADQLSELVAEAKEDGIQIRELAERIGISAGSLSQYQSDNATASIDALYKIARYFNVSTDFLLGLTTVRTNEGEIREVCDYTGLDEDVVEKLHSQQKNHHRGAIALLNYLLRDGAILSDLGEYYCVNFWDEDIVFRFGRLFQYQNIPPRSRGHLFGNLLNDLPLDSEKFYNLCKQNRQLKTLMGCTYVENELDSYVKDQFQNRLYNKFHNKQVKGTVDMDESDKAMFDLLSTTGGIELLGQVIDLDELSSRIDSDLAKAELERTTEDDYISNDDGLPF